MNLKRVYKNSNIYEKWRIIKMRKTQMVNAKVNEVEKTFCTTKVNVGNKSNVEFDELNAVNEAGIRRNF